MSRILVTGGTGFIGANLVLRLLKHKKNVVTIFADRPHHPFLEKKTVKIVEGDIRRYNDVLGVMKKQDYVYHLAATSLSDRKRKKEIFGINVRGTENVMKAALACKVKKVVYTGSAAGVGFACKERLLTEMDDMEFIDNIYAQSKRYGEDKVLAYVKKGVHASIVLPSYVMGPGEVDPVRYGLFQSLYHGRIRFAYPGGGGTVDVRDLVEGLMLAMKKGKDGERYLFNATYMRLFDLYNTVAKMLHAKRVGVRIPYSMYYPAYFLGFVCEHIFDKAPITRESVRWAFNYKKHDSSKAYRELGWKPTISLDDTIKDQIAYYKEIGVLPT